MHEFGYGVDYTKITWKNNVKDLLVKTAVEKTEYIRGMYEEFCRDTDDAKNDRSVYNETHLRLRTKTLSGDRPCFTFSRSSRRFCLPTRS